MSGLEVSLWKRTSCFPPTLRWRNSVKTQQSPVILILTSCVWGKPGQGSEVIVFQKLRFQNVFSLHENEKPAFSNSSSLKSVFEKLRFLDRLVWTVGLTVEIKLRFQIPPA